MLISVDNYFLKKSKVFELIHKTKDEIVAILGHDFNDRHSNKWMYRRGSYNGFWAKKYMYIIFNDKDKAIEVQLKRWKEKQPNKIA